VARVQSKSEATHQEQEARGHFVVSLVLSCWASSVRRRFSSKSLNRSCV